MAGADGMLLAVEQEQDGVASPFDQPGAIRIGDVEQLAEHRIEDLGQLLGADLALGRETFRQPRETGDIDER